MAVFDVTVAGRDYTVDANDENDAWVKANKMHLDSTPSIGNAIKHIPESAKKYGAGIVEGITQAVTNPRSILDIGAAGMMKVMPDKVNEVIDKLNWDKDEQNRVSSVANAIGGVYKDRYGSPDAIKRTLTVDPIGSLGDLSAILSSGGSLASRLPSLTKAASVASKAGMAIDPLKVITSPLKTAAPILGMTTGTGTLPIKEAYKAGKTGGEAGEAFSGQLRKTAPIESVVDDARTALENIKSKRNEDYRAGMVDISNDKKILDFTDVEKALDSVQSSAYYKGALKNPQAADVFNQINSAISEWKALDPAIYHTPEGIDALKQRIGNIQKGYLQAGKEPSLRIATAAYNSLKDLIQKQAPTYAKVMSGYENASAELADIEKTLSLGRNASVDTSLRKLQSIMRDEANTNWGRRINVGKTLEASGADMLMPKLAGQSLSSLTPRGLVGRGSAMSELGTAAKMAAGGTLTIPMGATIGAGLAASSPRLVGEAAFAAGKAASIPSKLGDLLSKYGDKIASKSPDMAFAIDSAKRAISQGKQVNPQVAKMLAIQLSRMEQAKQE